MSLLTPCISKHSAYPPPGENPSPSHHYSAVDSATLEVEARKEVLPYHLF